MITSSSKEVPSLSPCSSVVRHHVPKVPHEYKPFLSEALWLLGNSHHNVKTYHDGVRLSIGVMAGISKIKIELQIHKTVEQEETGRDGKKEKQREVANIQLARCWTHRPCPLTSEVILRLLHAYKENGFKSQVTKRGEIRRRGGSSQGRAYDGKPSLTGGGVGAGWQDQDSGSLRRFMQIKTKEMTGKPSVKLNYHPVCHLIQSRSKFEHEDTFFFSCSFFYFKLGG